MHLATASFWFEQSLNNTYMKNSASGNLEVDTLGSAKRLRLINGERYSFYQVHWHSHSENTVDGIPFPLEAYFVHQLDDVALHGTYHRLVVIGLFYELGGNAIDPLTMSGQIFQR